MSAKGPLFFFCNRDHRRTMDVALSASKPSGRVVHRLPGPRPGDRGREAGRVVGKSEAFVFAALISILVLTQTPPAFPIELAAPGAGTVKNCNASNYDFEGGLKQLAETITERTDIPSEFLQTYFAECTIEKAREFLNKHGFRTGKAEPEFDDSEPGKVIPRTITAGKTMRLFDRLVSLNCRIILENDASNGLSVFGFFYFDGP